MIFLTGVMYEILVTSWHPFIGVISGYGQRLDRDIFYQDNRLYCLRGFILYFLLWCFPVGPGGCLSYSRGEMTKEDRGFILH